MRRKTGSRKQDLSALPKSILPKRRPPTENTTATSETEEVTQATAATKYSSCDVADRFLEYAMYRGRATPKPKFVTGWSQAATRRKSRYSPRSVTVEKRPKIEIK